MTFCRTGPGTNVECRSASLTTHAKALLMHPYTQTQSYTQYRTKKPLMFLISHGHTDIPEEPFTPAAQKVTESFSITWFFFNNLRTPLSKFVINWLSLALVDLFPINCAFNCHFNSFFPICVKSFKLPLSFDSHWKSIVKLWPRQKFSRKIFLLKNNSCLLQLRSWDLKFYMYNSVTPSPDEDCVIRLKAP